MTQGRVLEIIADMTPQECQEALRDVCWQALVIHKGNRESAFAYMVRGMTRHERRAISEAFNALESQWLH